MRVIAGSARGHQLTAPPGLDVRPTADKVKGALFSMLHNDISGCSFLDLFSGTGAIGIEALSRGADYCVFVEKAAEHCTYIHNNLAHVHKAIQHNNYLVINQDINEAFPLLEDNGIKFDIIFMDPPYNKGLINDAIDLIHQYNILSENGYIVIEQGSNEPNPVSEFFEVYKIKKYRSACIYFMKAL